MCTQGLQRGLPEDASKHKQISCFPRDKQGRKANGIWRADCFALRTGDQSADCRSVSRNTERTRRTETMEWIRRAFRIDIRESHLGTALVFCLIAMSVMSIAIVWQA